MGKEKNQKDKKPVKRKPYVEEEMEDDEDFIIPRGERGFVDFSDDASLDLNDDDDDF